MRYVIATLLLTPQFAKADEPTQKQWVKVSPPGSGFQVLLPGKPTESSNPPMIKDSARATQLFTYEASKNHPFIVSYSDLGGTGIPKEKEMKVLESIRDGREKSLKGEVLKDGVVIRAGLSGRQFTMKIASGLYYRSLIFVKKNRVYQAYVLGTEKEVMGKEAEKFLNSFEVLADEQEKK